MAHVGKKREATGENQRGAKEMAHRRGRSQCRINGAGLNEGREKANAVEIPPLALHEQE